jgi:hypothetical protein
MGFLRNCPKELHIQKTVKIVADRREKSELILTLSASHFFGKIFYTVHGVLFLYK